MSIDLLTRAGNVDQLSVLVEGGSVSQGKENASGSVFQMLDGAPAIPRSQCRKVSGMRTLDEPPACIGTWTCGLLTTRRT